MVSIRSWLTWRHVLGTAARHRNISQTSDDDNANGKQHDSGGIVVHGRRAKQRPELFQSTGTALEDGRWKMEEEWDKTLSLYSHNNNIGDADWKSDLTN